jgi:hypothetical protein
MAELPISDPGLKPDRLDTYKVWQAEQNIPCVRGFFVKDVNEVPVEYWDLKGVPCSFVVLDGTGGTNDAYVCEIPAGGKTKPQKHLYEEMVYVSKGYGATTVWQRDGKKKHTFEWGPGCSRSRSMPITNISMPAAAKARAISPSPTPVS